MNSFASEAWQKYTRTEYYDQIPDDDFSKIFQKAFRESYSRGLSFQSERKCGIIPVGCGELMDYNQI